MSVKKDVRKLKIDVKWLKREVLSLKEEVKDLKADMRWIVGFQIATLLAVIGAAVFK